jgi:hypothetical protein
MLLGLLFALIFGPSGEAEFVSVVPNLDQEIKQTITDKERRKDLLDLVDAYEGAIKEFTKDKKQLQKQVNQSSGDRNVSSETLLMHYDEYHQARRRLITSLIDYRLMFQEQITEKELMLLIEKAIVTSEKDKLDAQKLEEKTEDELNKAFSQIHDIIVRNILDPVKSETVTKSFYTFEQSMYNYLDISRDAKADRTALLLYIDATREELGAVYEQSNQVRYRAANDFAVLRDRVIENTSEKEWKQINKELKVFFKN